MSNQLAEINETARRLSELERSVTRFVAESRPTIEAIASGEGFRLAAEHAHPETRAVLGRLGALTGLSLDDFGEDVQLRAVAFLAFADAIKKADDNLGFRAVAGMLKTARL